MKKFKTAKQFLLLAFFVVCVNYLHAQKSTTAMPQPQKRSDSLPPQRTAPQNILQSNNNDTVIENRLVQLALGQPLYQQAESQNKILDYQLKKQRNTWLNLLSLSTTYNDQSFTKVRNNNTTTAYVYPKYFLGVTIPLGLIVSNGTDVKITRQSQLIVKEQQQELAKNIRADVLKNYKQYKANEKLLIIQNQVLDDEQANFLQVEQKFKNGTATLDEYNNASKKYNDQSVTIINLQLQQDLVKVELERLIGMRLEDALK
jgi:outer membrane protein TolC